MCFRLLASYPPPPPHNVSGFTGRSGCLHCVTRSCMVAVMVLDACVWLGRLLRCMSACQTGYIVYLRFASLSDYTRANPFVVLRLGFAPALPSLAQIHVLACEHVR